MLSRRALLGASALLALAACNGTGGTTDPISTIGDDIRLLAAFAKAAQGFVALLPGLAPGDLQNIETSLTEIIAEAPALIAALPQGVPTDLAGWINGLERVVNLIVPLVPATAPYAALIAAAEGLIPIILAFGGITPSAVAARAETGHIPAATPAEARRTLRKLPQVVK